MNTRLVRRLGVTVVVFGLAIGTSGPARTGPSGFRCPSTGRLISVGLSPLEVKNRCREPDEFRTTIETRTVREKVRRWVNGVAGEVSVERTVDIPIEDWTYDFGRNRFVEFLHFEQGHLLSVAEGEKGSGDPE